MFLKAKHSGRLLCWTLALLVPAQPFFALNCPCACAGRALTEQASRANQQAVPSHGRKCCRTCKGRCKNGSPLAKSRSNCKTPYFRIALRGCQCPADCDCQWQHASEPQLAAGPKRIEFPLVMATAPLCQPITLSQTQSIAVVADALPQGKSWATSSLSHCAQFCRFII